MIDLATLGTIISAAVILMAWSSLYRTTVLYHTAESLTVGMYLGFTFAEGVLILSRRIFQPLFLQGKWMSDLTILVLIGLLYYTRLVKGKEWPSRIPMAILAGIATGLAVKGTVDSQILQQVMVRSVVGKTSFDTFNNILIVVITFGALSYMIYTREHTGLLKISTKIGRIGLMAAFGWTLGTYLMSLISFAVGQAGVLATAPGIYLTIPALLWVGIDIAKRIRM